MKTPKLPIVVLVSGNGSNLQAIIDNCKNVEIKAVISNNIDAYAGVRAMQSDIPYIVDIAKEHDTRRTYDERLATYINIHEPKLIILAGFMRILSQWFTDRFHGQVINIHPSLLPKYKGLHTHRRVYEARDLFHGITIHYVTEELDSGPIIIQRKFNVSADDTPETLEEKIHRLEHQWYPFVIDVLAAEKLINTHINQ